MSDPAEISNPEPRHIPGEIRLVPQKHGGALRIGGSPGRPKTKHLKRELVRLANQRVPAQIMAILSKQGFKGSTYAEAWAFAAFRASCLGEVPAVKEIADRLDGKVRDEIEVSGGLDFGVAIVAAYERARSPK